MSSLKGFSANKLVHITKLESFAVLQIITTEGGKVLRERNEAISQLLERKAEVDKTLGEHTGSPKSIMTRIMKKRCHLLRAITETEPLLSNLQLHMKRSTMMKPITMMIVSNIAQTST